MVLGLIFDAGVDGGRYLLSAGTLSDSCRRRPQGPPLASREVLLGSRVGGGDALREGRHLHRKKGFIIPICRPLPLRIPVQMHRQKDRSNNQSICLLQAYRGFAQFRSFVRI